MITLRPYQQQGVEELRAVYRNGGTAPLYVLPTGGGKTVVFSHIAQQAAQRGGRVFILVHRVELLRQTSSALNTNGVPHGMVNPKYSPDYSKAVQVASVQTLARRLHLFANRPPSLIIIDEAHHAPAGTWAKVLNAFPAAKVLGVTATPERGDGKGLGGVFTHMVQGPSITQLIREGYLVRPQVFAPLQRISMAGVKQVAGDYDKAQAAERVDKPTITGNAVAHYAKLCPGRPAVVFCISVQHAEHVAAEFRARGFRAHAVDGSMDDERRSSILSGLGDGRVEVVTSCDLISEGTDIPAIACAILLRPTKSVGLYIQQVGRALRTSNGKDSAIILDHVGNVLEHGMPDAEREWSLQGRIKKKKGKAQDPALRVKQCPKCYAVNVPAPACQTCGHIYEGARKAPQVQDGTLQEVTAQAAALLAKQKRREVGQAQTLEELRRIAATRGYRPGWAEHIFKARQNKQT